MTLTKQTSAQRLPLILQAPLLSDLTNTSSAYLASHFQITNAMNSPQVIWLNTAEIPLGIRDLREVSPRWSYANSSLFFVVILSADSLSTETQNALLKTLEEPPHQVQFLLVTSHPQSLLPTIRSRCELVGDQTLPVLTPEQNELVTSILQDLKPGIYSSAIEASEQFKDRSSAQEWVTIALVWSQKQKINKSVLDQPATSSNIDWIQWQKALLVADRQLSTNVNVKLCMTELFFSYLSATDK